MINFITLYHGSFYKTKRPIVHKELFIGRSKMVNHYGGICTSQDIHIARCYGEYLHTYKMSIENVANNQDLMSDVSINIIQQELQLDDLDFAKEITYAVVSQVISPKVHGYFLNYIKFNYMERSENTYNKVICRLKGILSYNLGFQAVSYIDELGFNNYLIVH